MDSRSSVSPCGRNYDARAVAARRVFVAAGVVLTRDDFAARRGARPTSLPGSVRCGDLFSVEVDRPAYYPAELLKVEPEAAGAVCCALGGLSPASKFIFWMRPRGALGGLTAVEAISRGRVALVAELAGLLAFESHASPGPDRTPLQLEDAATLISVSTAFLARQVDTGALHVGRTTHTSGWSAVSCSCGMPACSMVSRLPRVASDATWTPNSRQPAAEARRLRCTPQLMGEATWRSEARWLYSEYMSKLLTRALQSLLANGVLAVLFAAAPTLATAEAWVAMDNGRGYRYEFDADAVERVTNGVYRVRWRWGREFFNDFSTDTLRVECSEHKVVIERSVSLNRSMYPSDPARQVFTNDFLEGTSTSYWGKKPLSADEKMRAVRFPTSGSPESRLVRALCQGEPFFRQLHEVAGEDVQKRWGCDTPRLATAPMCKPDLETRELLGQLIMRMDQVEKACALSSDDANLISRVWLKEAEACRGTVCDLSLMQINIDGLGGDLMRAAAGQRCTYAASAVGRAQQSEARDAASVRFTECLAKTIPALDDKVSPANVVAEGVYAACRGELTPDLASNSNFAATVIPSVTSQVLRARQESSNPVPKPQPKPAAKPKPAPAAPAGQRV